MKRNKAWFLLLLLLFLLTPGMVHAEEELTQVIEIKTVEDLITLQEACRLDIYSVHKVVELKNSIDVAESDFTGIPYFDGVFHGNGYTISGLKLNGKGSQIGLFRYIGELGVVSDVKVIGDVQPSGSQVEIGGIAGVNNGLIQNCYFEGTVCGIESVGAIAGRNKSAGKIFGCSSNAQIMATNETGGIAGVNEGIIDDCINKSNINTEELETFLDLGGIDIGTLNLAQNVITRNNMGGICGSSTGIISKCRNYGEIGFAHTGYNVGGIAGCQSGVILHATNDGKVYGRKDVGGIVGQAQPYIESEYLSNQIEQTKNDIERMNRTLTNLAEQLEKSSSDASTYADALLTQYEAANGSLGDRLDAMGSAIPEDNAEAEECRENISKAQKRIQEILDANTDGVLSSTEREELRKQQQIIEENTTRLEEIAREQEGNSSTDAYEADENSVTGLSNAISDGIDAMITGIDRLTIQANNAMNHLYDNTAVLRGEKDFISDVSSIKTASIMDGVISECINRGRVEGDINVGGIAGTMNIEYEEDPESDYNSENSLDFATSSTVNDILLANINYGKIVGKRNCMGSIVGLQEFGLIHSCEGYGHVKTNAGNYVGGIAGQSKGTIEQCYSIVDLNGNDYMGGIVGVGKNILNCLTMGTIETDGECIGGVAGQLEGNGTVKENYFVKETYDGIDNISYLGVAEAKSYEDMMELEGVPKGFKRVLVTFELDDEVVSERMIPYGAGIHMEDFPLLIDREDAYAKWPNSQNYENIRNNITIEAEYIPWKQSIASREQLENKAVFLAVAHFYEEDEIHLSDAKEVYEVKEGQTLLYSYDWKLVTSYDKTYDEVEGHFYVPQAALNHNLELWICKDGQWSLSDFEWDGSYIAAKLPFEASFSLVEVEKTKKPYYLFLLVWGVLVLFAGVFSVVAMRRRRKNKGM